MNPMSLYLNLALSRTLLLPVPLTGQAKELNLYTVEWKLGALLSAVSW